MVVFFVRSSAKIFTLLLLWVMAFFFSLSVHPTIHPTVQPFHYSIFLRSEGFEVLAESEEQTFSLIFMTIQRLTTAATLLSVFSGCARNRSWGKMEKNHCCEFSSEIQKKQKTCVWRSGMMRVLFKFLHVFFWCERRAAVFIDGGMNDGDADFKCSSVQMIEVEASKWGCVLECVWTW